MNDELRQLINKYRGTHELNPALITADEVIKNEKMNNIYEVQPEYRPMFDLDPETRDFRGTKEEWIKQTNGMFPQNILQEVEGIEHTLRKYDDFPLGIFRSDGQDIIAEDFFLFQRAKNGELVESKTINIPKGEGCLEDDDEKHYYPLDHYDFYLNDHMITIHPRESDEPISNAQKLTNEIKGEKPETVRVNLNDQGTGVFGPCHCTEEKPRHHGTLSGRELREPIIEKDMNCEHCEFLEKVFGDDINDNREYWIFTEVFVHLHGTDVCNNKKFKPNSPIIDNGTKKYTQMEMIQLVNEWIYQAREFEEVFEGMSYNEFEKSFKEFLKDK